MLKNFLELSGRNLAKCLAGGVLCAILRYTKDRKVLIFEVFGVGSLSHSMNAFCMRRLTNEMD